MRKKPYLRYGLITIGILLVSTLIVYLLNFWNVSDDNSNEMKVTKVYTPNFNQDNLELDSIVLVTNNYEPYVFENESEFSYAEEIVKVALTAAEVNYVIEKLPWERCIVMVQTGEAFGTFPYIKTESRSSDYVFSSSIMGTLNDFTAVFYNDNFLNPSEISRNMLSDLEGYRVGAMSHYYYLPELDQSGIQPEIAFDEVYLFQELAEGRLDFVISNRYVGQYISQSIEGGEHLKILDFIWPVEYDFYDIMMNKENPYAEWLIGKFDEGLQIIKENRKYYELESRFYDDYFK